MEGRRRRTSRALVGAAVVTLLAVGVPVLLAGEQTSAVDATSVPAPETTRPTPSGPTPPGSPASAAVDAIVAPSRTFDRTARSTTDPASLWVVINKSHPITPTSYVPPLTVVGAKEVGQAIAGPLRAMLRAAAEAGAPLEVVSGFRTYDRQHSIYQAQLAETGSVEAADAVSARPGHSEHQSGLAIDVDDAHDGSCQLNPCFAGTAAGRWVAEHAGEFGFLVRYAEETTEITGYAAEPWHLRYVGRRLVRAMEEAGVATLEEFFTINGGDYPNG